MCKVYKTYLLSRLSFLPNDILVNIFDSLALVGLRGAFRPDNGGEITHDGFVVPRDGDHGGGITRDGYSLRRLHDEGVRVSQAQLDILALHSCSVPNSDELELLLMSLRYSSDHVLCEGAGETVQLTGGDVLLSLSHNQNIRTILNALNQVWELVMHLAQLALNGQFLTFELVSDSSRYGDGQLANTGVSTIYSKGGALCRNGGREARHGQGSFSLRECALK
mmetsp:Transcript_35297/g.49000  ORF Transcript_35297/g.49000 Transcript_35297/m.49000 type:complete len:222 (-) Transcript_35297:256-921(-)